jgi:hypothetical protein
MAKVSFGEHGQFFTPANVSNMMARLVYSSEPREGETICDPCCGSGRFFISVSKVNRNAHFYGVDLSPTCAKMTALNMWIFNLDADIYHGDSLALRMFHVWKIRKGGFLYESEITESVPPMPEKVRRTLKIQAEQQKLFDFVGLDFGHSPRNQIAGKWQPAEGFMAGAWEAASFRDVYLPTRLQLISRRPLPALAWSAKG